MKAIAHRPRDLSDIETVLDAHPDLDMHEVMTTVQAFAEALDQPEIAQDLARLFSGIAKSRPTAPAASRRRVSGGPAKAATSGKGSKSKDKGKGGSRKRQ